MATSKILIDGVGIDLTNDTVTSETLALGVTAHNNNGEIITGTLNPTGGGGIDTSEDTVTESVLLTGYTAHNSQGESITGTMPNYGDIDKEILIGQPEILPGGYYHSINLSATKATFKRTVYPLSGEGNVDRLPVTVIELKKGEIVQITYNLKNVQGYVYDARYSGNMTDYILQSNQVNAVVTIQYTAPKDMVFLVSGHYSTDRWHDGQLAQYYGDALYGYYYTVEILNQTVEPSGTINIDANGTYDIYQYALANVQVPLPVGNYNITQNGNYDITQYETIYVNVPTYQNTADPRKIKILLHLFDWASGNPITSCGMQCYIRSTSGDRRALASSYSDGNGNCYMEAVFNSSGNILGMSSTTNLSSFTMIDMDPIATNRTWDLSVAGKVRTFVQGTNATRLNRTTHDDGQITSNYAQGVFLEFNCWLKLI